MSCKTSGWIRAREEVFSRSADDVQICGYLLAAGARLSSQFGCHRRSEPGFESRTAMRADGPLPLNCLNEVSIRALPRDWFFGRVGLPRSELQIGRNAARSCC